MYQHPNKPCPCGSGIKAKKCHPFGAPVHGCSKETPIPVVRDREAEMALFMIPLMLGAALLSARTR